jgi:VCBS repeat-containing protein
MLQRPDLASVCRFGLRGAFEILLIVAAALPSVSTAATIHVPADQPTLQAAVDAAASGDLVLFAPGTYEGGAYVTGKSLTFASWYLTTGDTAYIAQTVLGGSRPGYCASGCVNDAVLEFHRTASVSEVVGLTLTGTYKGIRTSAIVNVSHCRFVGLWDGVNYESQSGGTIADSYFADNADDGIDFQDQASMTILRNVIRDNADDGIELRMYPYSGPTLDIVIRDNQFIHNDEDGIQFIDSPDSSHREIWVERNFFTDQRKAGIGCMGNQQTREDFSGSPIQERMHVSNNTFVGENYGIVGGANTIALNNIFQNTALSALRKVAGNSIASYNVFWNNGVAAESSNVDVAHTLYADPLLTGDYQLGAGSPAIDAGTDHFEWQGETVLDLAGSYLGSAPDPGWSEFNSNAPVAVRDPVTVPEGGRLQVPSPGVLGNDSDPNGDPLTVEGVLEAPLHGSLSLNADGSFEYQHDGSEAPGDSFAYQVGDGNGNHTRAEVVIDVQPVNDQPAATFDTFIVDLDSSDDPLDVLRNDHDPDAGDTLSLVALNLSGTAGTAVVHDNAVRYTPPPGFTGYDSFGYTVRDASGAVAAAQVSVRVADVTVGHVAVRVRASSDDAEEPPNGNVSITSGDLELIHDASDQTVGIRWVGLAIPRDAIITAAWVQFTAREAQDEPTALTIQGQAAEAPATFATSPFDVSARPRTTAAVDWSPAAWSPEAAETDQRTPDLSAVIQEIVASSGPSGVDSLALIITGNGHRTAYSHNGSSTKAALLHVDYIAGVPAAPLAVEGGAAPEPAWLGVSPNPARGPLRLEFALTGRGPATLELLDVAGRRVMTRQVGALGPGRHRVDLSHPLPAGVYLARLVQGGTSRVAKVVRLE